MTSDLQKRVSKLFDEVPMDLELHSEDVETTPDMEELMHEVKRLDNPYNLKLENPIDYIRFSIVALADGDPYEAEEWAKKAIKLDKSCEALIARGNALFRQGDHKGALGVYDEALSYCEEKDKVHRYRYRTLKKRGMNERALQALEKAFDISRDLEIMGEYADTLVDIGEIERAKKYYERLEKLTDNNTKIQNKIEELLKEASTRTIPEDYEEILKLDTSCKEAWIGKAERYWVQGRKKDAVECLRTSKKHIKDDAVDELLKDYLCSIPKSKRCHACDGSGDCSNCSGSGDCNDCSGSGKCSECFGAGHCSKCLGTKECPDCEGTGKPGWFGKCRSCDGTGVCQDCDKYGSCPECDRLGDCTTCSGTGNCGDCNGSGVCAVCEGKGILIV